MSKQWYVVRAISGQEKKVKQYIESEIERLKLETFIAQVLIPRVWCGHRRAVRLGLARPAGAGCEFNSIEMNDTQCDGSISSYCWA